jgi:hypothetical protein
MATLKILNNFELERETGNLSAKQGAEADGFADPLEVTVTGTAHYVAGQLATASVATVYDDDDDVPADWDYLYFWADQDCYIQIIGSGSNFTIKVEAYHAFVLPGFDTMLAAANTTAITGGTEPTLTDIDQIVIGNYSGSTMDYVFCVID